MENNSMKTSAWLCALTMAISAVASADTIKQDPKDTALSGVEIAFDQVRVSMQRLLKSSNGEYFLSLYAGIWNPSATLTRLDNQRVLTFKGKQKGNDLDLEVVNLQENDQGIVQLKGELNANTGVFKSNLIHHDGKIITRRFEPAFKVEDKPLFIFKFYGIELPTHKFGKLMTRVDVLDKLNNKVVQSLSGFKVFPNSIGYMDVNFDGYYDIVLSDLSEGKTLEDRRFIYWMYNPKTQQYQRASQLEQISGFPTLYGERQEIDFSNGRVFKVIDGLMHPVAKSLEKSEEKTVENQPEPVQEPVVDEAQTQAQSFDQENEL